MSFEEGFHATDLASIQTSGLQRSDIAALLSKTFCQQMYRHGFVHCDPHEANVLIRPHPRDSSRPQLVLLDHGLYKQLPDEFRREYCRLWNALILGDMQEIEKHCRNLKAGDAFPLLSAILTMKPWNDIISKDVDSLHSKGSKTEHEMLKSYAKKYFKEVILLLGEMQSGSVSFV
jgi:aarF domain-containing kinase